MVDDCKLGAEDEARVFLAAPWHVGNFLLRKMRRRTLYSRCLDDVHYLMWNKFYGNLVDSRLPSFSAKRAVSMRLQAESELESYTKEPARTGVRHFLRRFQPLSRQQ